MRIEIKDNIKDKNIIQKYKNILHNLDKKIVKLIENQDYTMLLTHCIQDIQDIENGETIQKNYVENMQEYPYRGILSNENKDNRLYIAIFEKYLKIEHIEAILYHEIGHFLDIYKAAKEINPDNSLFLSSNDEFQNAYKYDLVKNWDKIKNDKSFRLIHYIQNSTPDKINPNAVIETFAEAFGVINNKLNDEKTVEKYFKNAIEVEKELLNKTYNLKF